MTYKIILKDRPAGVEIQRTEKGLNRVCKWLKDRVIHYYTLNDCDLKVVHYYDEATLENIITESIEDALE